MTEIKPTIRERQVFAALMNELIEHPALAGSGVSRDNLENAVSYFERGTLDMVEGAERRDAFLNTDDRHVDYRE